VYVNRRVPLRLRTTRISRRDVFIRAALVEGDFDTRAPFFAHNRRLLADIERLEHKSRRPDILVDDELITRSTRSAYRARSTALRSSKNGAARPRPPGRRLLFLAREDPDAARGRRHHHR
jgi:ATP-dependent helicase HrpA